MGYRTVIGCLVAGGTLVACGPSAPASGGSAAPSLSGVPPTTQSASAAAPVPSAGALPSPVFSGMTMLGQRSLASNSEDDPAAYHYLVQYSLDSLKTADTVSPGEDRGLVGTQITTSATIHVTNMTPDHSAPLNDLSGVMLAGAYKLDRGICHQRNIPVAGRGDYCFVSLWVSPDNPGELTAGETRQLGNSSPTRWEIGPLAQHEKDTLVKDLLAPDIYVVASLSNGYHFVPKNRCTFSFDLSTGHAIIDTQPHINICAES
jgi:hypothetical protein